MNGRTLIYRTGKKLYLSSDLFERHSGHQQMKEMGMHPGSRKSDWLDLGRVKVNLDPMSEWKQMYSKLGDFRRKLD
ncbi:MAG: hypothetical protein R3A12_09280 [Ignavibacteria bacterium]